MEQCLTYLGLISHICAFENDPHFHCHAHLRWKSVYPIKSPRGDHKYNPRPRWAHFIVDRQFHEGNSPLHFPETKHECFIASPRWDDFELPACYCTMNILGYFVKDEGFKLYNYTPMISIDELLCSLKIKSTRSSDLNRFFHICFKCILCDWKSMITP